MTLEVKYCLNLDEDICVDEDEINARFDVYYSSLLADENHDGTITINSSGQPVVRIEDELWASVQNLCFLSIPNLVVGKNVDLLYFSYNGHLRLDPIENEIVISGDYVPTVRIARQEFIDELYNCGHRFVKFLHRLRGNDPDFRDAIAYLEKQELVAIQALKAK